MQGVMLDITSRKRAEDELELRYAVQKGLAEAASLNEGLHGVLRTVAARFGWKVGAFWTVDEHEEELRLTDMWHAEDIDGRRASRAPAAGCGFAAGEGLPGRAWAAASRVWVEDVARRVELPARSRRPRRAACAAPSRARRWAGTRCGECSSSSHASRATPIPRCCRLLPSVSALLADFVATRAAIEEHRGRFQAVLDNAPAVVVREGPAAAATCS